MISRILSQYPTKDHRLSVLDPARNARRVQPMILPGTRAGLKWINVVLGKRGEAGEQWHWGRGVGSRSARDMECQLGMNEGQASTSGLVWVLVVKKFQESSASGEEVSEMCQSKGSVR